MKRISSFFAAAKAAFVAIAVGVAIVSLLVACQHEEDPIHGTGTETRPVAFSATIGAPYDVKATVDMADGKIAWASGDEITITNVMTNETGVYTANSAGASTDFTYKSGTKFAGSGTFVATYGTMPTAGTDQLYDVSPSGLIHMSAPDVKASGSSPVAAFTFTADCGLVKFNLTAASKSIKRIYASDGTATYKLLCETAQPVSSAKDFYIALPAGTYTTFTIRDNDGYEAVKTADNGMTETVLAAGQIQTVTFSDLSFADPVYPESNTAGVKVLDTWWAPVNCGFEMYGSDGYKGYIYGRLYQWGRKYGQGYYASSYKDETYLTEADILTYWTGANGDEDPDKFYVCASSGTTYEYDWIEVGSNQFWNSGTEYNSAEQLIDPYVVPTKTGHDPCPAGWRVPTYAELNQLICEEGESGITSGWGSADGFYPSQGFYLNGEGTGTRSTYNTIFLPAAGGTTIHGNHYGRGVEGGYWSSSVDGDYAMCLRFSSSVAVMTKEDRSYAFPIRCTQE